RAAHRRDRRRESARAALGVRRAGELPRRIHAGPHRGRRRRRIHAAVRSGGRRRDLRPLNTVVAMDSRPAIAVTSGEPAGIGPELCAMLAVRHARAPFDARLVLLGDRDLLEARAERIGLAPRYADYT